MNVELVWYCEFDREQYCTPMYTRSRPPRCKICGWTMTTEPSRYDAVVEQWGATAHFQRGLNHWAMQ